MWAKMHHRKHLGETNPQFSPSFQFNRIAHVLVHAAEFKCERLVVLYLKALYTFPSLFDPMRSGEVVLYSTPLLEQVLAAQCSCAPTTHDNPPPPPKKKKKKKKKTVKLGDRLYQLTIIIVEQGFWESLVSISEVWIGTFASLVPLQQTMLPPTVKVCQD